MGESGLELVVEPRTDRFDPGDDRWREQVAAFYAGLRREVGEVRRERFEAPGSKGGFETVVLALGSAGVFAAAVEYFRLWLARDRTRGLRITHTLDGREEVLVIQGEVIDNAVLETLAAALASRVSGRDG
jgi:hypothetical protein